MSDEASLEASLPEDFLLSLQPMASAIARDPVIAKLSQGVLIRKVIGGLCISQLARSMPAWPGSAHDALLIAVADAQPAPVSERAHARRAGVDGARAALPAQVEVGQLERGL